ncbi:hypothetical protein [Natronorubrum halophilum]|uniref:hypothetical protein n=1 Tax=Natronorubrum halophilum TaxID=1702106 RepID=UPI0010C22A0C|nr:hypothetical protein [Natronorubrum halophilum]
MDTRLIVTAPVTAYVAVLGLFALAQSTVGVTFTEGQPAFMIVIGLLGPVFALGLIWLKNYAYGAPLLVSAVLSNAWFVTYFFFVHDNSANVFAASGDGTTAYLMSAVGLVATSLILGGVGCWLWYRESAQFRTAVDRFIRPSTGPGH